MGFQEIFHLILFGKDFEIVKAAKINNKSLGIMVNSKEELNRYHALGFNMIAVGTEMNILKKGISDILI